jgi:hypothetical protein
MSTALRSIYLVEACESGFIDGRWVEKPLAYKLGVAEKVDARVRSLQTGSFAPLVVVAEFKAWDAYAMEKWLHNIWIGHRLRGEWFRPDESICRSMQKLAELFGALSDHGLQLVSQNMCHNNWLYQYIKDRTQCVPRWLQRERLENIKESAECMTALSI